MTLIFVWHLEIDMSGRWVLTVIIVFEGAVSGKPLLVKPMYAVQIHPHEQPGYLRPRTQVTDERKGLLLAKRALLQGKQLCLPG
jgi:hypothetical protein